MHDLCDLETPPATLAARRLRDRAANSDANPPQRAATLQSIADLEARLRGADGNSTTNNTTTSDGGVAYGGYGNAFRYVFTNLFDFCIQDGLYRLVPLLGDVETTLAHYNFLRDGGDTLDAWLDNAVNTLLWPLPQTNADFTCSCSRRGDGGWENCEARTHAR